MNNQAAPEAPPRWLCRLYDAFISALLLGTAYLLRAVAPLTVVSWDEPAWVLRSARFLLALRSGHLAGTAQTGHPGVITMWTGALSLNWHRLVTGRVSLAEIESAARIEFPAQVQDIAALRELTALLPYAKGGIWLLNALIVVGAYLLLRRLVPRRMALVGGLVLALTPYYTALSRLLHLDALMAGTMLLSVLAALAYRERPRRWLAALSGALVALAGLTRSAGLIIAPVALALIVVTAWRDRQRRLPALLEGLGLWAGSAALTMALLWPALWVDPLRALGQVVDLSFRYTLTDPGATTTFFRGQVVERAGALFYPLVVWFRITPLAVVFAPLAALSGLLSLPLERDDARRRLSWTLTAVALYVLAVLTLSAKQFDRYALPALLAIELLSGIGLALALDLLAERVLRPGALQLVWRSVIVALGGALLVGLSWLAEVAPLFPGHLLAYYNSLAGGLPRAVETLPVGWGEGLPEAADILARLPRSSELTVATWGAAGLAPTFSGKTVPLKNENLPAADYVLVYVSDLQNGDGAAARYYGRREASAVVSIDGVAMAWLYDNDDPEIGQWLAVTQRWLDDTQSSESLAVSNADAAILDRYAPGDWRVIQAADLDEVAMLLRREAAGRSAVIYLQYPHPDASGRQLRRQLDQSALLIEQHTSRLGEARRYALIPSAELTDVAPTQAAGVRWANGLSLRAQGLSAQAQYRQAVGLALELVSAEPQKTDWHLFARVLDAQGRVWGALDQPLRDVYGADTSEWAPGQRYDGRYSVPLRAGIPWGSYRVVVGLYELDGMRRVDLLDAAGHAAGTELTLGEVRVQPAMIPASRHELSAHVPIEQQVAGIELLGYQLDGDAYATGERVDLALFWQPPARVVADVWASFGWRGANGTLTWLPPQPLAGEGRETEDWGWGDALEIHYDLRVPETLTDGEAELLLNVQVGAEGQRLLPEPLTLTTVSIAQVPRLYEPPDMQHRQQAELGTTARLLGYDVNTALGDAGRTAEVTLYWQALNPSEVALMSFVHLLDEAGVVRGQVDQQPAQGARPTTGWVPGEIIADTYLLTLNDDAPAGPYRVEIGLYDPQTLERLAAVDAAGHPLPDDAVLLRITLGWPEQRGQ